ncbi:hypothetical protein FKP32DRAFT_1678072 [Trametes sanguinea]|nr:hypothetical protein FKP32DRAFT_1678072 [Trametes sanguinea]
MQRARRPRIAEGLVPPSSSGSVLLPSVTDDLEGILREPVPPSAEEVIITVTRTRTSTIIWTPILPTEHIPSTPPTPTTTAFEPSFTTPASPTPSSSPTSTSSSFSPPKVHPIGPSFTVATPRPETVAPVPSSPQPADPSTSSAPSFAVELEFAASIVAASCAGTTIEWTYTGPESTITIAISDPSPPQGDAPVGSPHRVLAQVDATKHEWPWFVNITSAWYTMALLGGGVGAESAPFFVQNSTNTSCLSSGGGSGQSSGVSSIASSSFTSLAASSTSSGISPNSTGTTTTTSSSQHTRAGVIAGAVVAGIAALIALVALAVCARTVLAQRARRSQPVGRRQPETWLGLPAGSGTQRTDSVSIASTNEKVPLTPSGDSNTAPPAPLQPNRRKPSVLAIDTSALNPTPPQEHAEALALPVPPTERGDIREDSPTLPPSAYVTRKPVPPLPPYESLDHTKPSDVSSRKSKDYDPSLASAVPSTATSRMYRTRDSGWSTGAESRFYRELGNARASSVIDPHLIGALKPMQNAMIPDVPPLPQDYT